MLLFRRVWYGCSESRSIAPRSIAPPLVRCPLFFATPVNSPLDKTPPPRSNAPSCQTILPVSGRENMYSVYYVVIDTGIGAIFLRKKTRKEQHMVRE